MIRPTAPVAERANARQLASARAARAAEISRRAAAGRRRTLLLAVLAGLTIGVWAAVVAGPVAWGWGILPSVLLAGVGYLGVRMFISDRAADTKARSEMKRLDQRLRLFRTEEAAASTAPVRRRRPSFDEILTGGGAHAAPVVMVDEKPRHARPGAIPDWEIEEVEAEPLEGGRIVGAHRAAPIPEAGDTWTPVPVPAPTYTMKVEVPRRTISPYDDEVLDDASATVPARPAGGAPPFLDPDALEEQAQTFDLNDVLARRRAAGA